MIDLKNINLETLKRYTSSQAVNDFDKFLDDLPSNVGGNNLMAVFVMWVIAGFALFFAMGQSDKLLTLQKELNEVNALKPPVPVLEYKPVDKDVLDKLSEVVSDTYKGIKITVRQGGSVLITAQDIDFSPQFIASISSFQRGARNWKVSIVDMCVGRDCIGAKLKATLSIEKVRVITKN